jgi:hypothetical protein
LVDKEHCEKPSLQLLKLLTNYLIAYLKDVHSFTCYQRRTTACKMPLSLADKASSQKRSKNPSRQASKNRVLGALGVGEKGIREPVGLGTLPSVVYLNDPLSEHLPP